MSKGVYQKVMRRIDTEQVRAQLDQLSRDPFRDMLAEIIGSRPSPEAVAALAQRNPDRYGQLLAIVARLAGFNEKLEVEANVYTRLSSMSDTELEQRLAELERAQAPAAPAPAEPPRRRRQPRQKLLLITPPQDGEQADEG